MKINSTGPHWAFVQSKNKIYYAHCDLTMGAPYTPVTKLLQNFFDTHLDQSFFTLRNRIFCNYQPTELCSGMTKVVAKRISPLLEFANKPFDQMSDFFNSQNLNHECLEFIEIQGPLMGPFLRDEQSLNLDEELQTRLSLPLTTLEEALQLLDLLSLKIPRGEVLHDFHRPISAIIVNNKNQILSYGIHSGSQNKTLHAEVNALQKLFKHTQQGIPSGAKMYVSHKPCKMCAAMIWRMAEDLLHFKIYFRDLEQGGFSKTTILDENSAERVNYSLPDLHKLKIQCQFSELARCN
jgi:tRNA(Arg) A34 adenosine deaminase TadA